MSAIVVIIDEVIPIGLESSMADLGALSFAFRPLNIELYISLMDVCLTRRILEVEHYFYDSLEFVFGDQSLLFNSQLFHFR